MDEIMTMMKNYVVYLFLWLGMPSVIAQIPHNGCLRASDDQVISIVVLHNGELLPGQLVNDYDFMLLAIKEGNVLASIGTMDMEGNNGFTLCKSKIHTDGLTLIFEINFDDFGLQEPVDNRYGIKLVVKNKQTEELGILVKPANDWEYNGQYILDMKSGYSERSSIIEDQLSERKTEDSDTPELSVKVYPNPIDRGGIVNVEADPETINLSGSVIEIYTVSGIFLQRIEVKDSITPVNFSGLSGLHLIKFMTSDGRSKIMRILVK